MVELILLLILVTIGILWFRNLSDNSEKGNDEVEVNLKINKWGTYISIVLVSGFFVWLLITNGNFN